MRSLPWRRILSSAMVFATVAVGLVGSSGTWAAGESKEYEELGRSLEHVLAEDLVREFMETILGGALDGCAGEALLVSYISKEYFESRWLDPNDFKVNFYHFSEFRIIEAEPPIRGRGNNELPRHWMDCTGTVQSGRRAGQVRFPSFEGREDRARELG